MRDTVTALALILIIGGACVALQSCKQPIISEFTLDNGLRIINVQSPHDQVVALNIVLKGGTDLVEMKKAGLEYFLLKVMSMATSRYSRKELEKRMDEHHFSIAVQSDFDSSSYNLICTRKHFDDSIQVFLDTFLKPAFNKDDIEEVRKQLINEVQQQLQDPYRKMSYLGNKACFKGHPYGIPTNGTIDSLKSISADDLKAFYKKRWVASRMFVVCVGKISEKELRLRLNSLGTIKKGSFSIPPQKPLQEVIRNDVFPVTQKELPNFHARSNFTSVAMSDSRYAAYLLMGNMMGDLMQTTIRTWNGIAYTPFCIGARPFKASYGSLFLLGCSDLRKALALTKECLGYLAKGIGRLEYRNEKGEVLTDKKLQKPEYFRQIPIEKVLPRYKNMLITSYYTQLSTNQSQASRIALYEVAGGGYANAVKFMSNLKAVTAADIQKAAKEVEKSKMYWMFVSNDKQVQTIGTQKEPLW